MERDGKVNLQLLRPIKATFEVFSNTQYFPCISRCSKFHYVPFPIASTGGIGEL